MAMVSFRLGDEANETLENYLSYNDNKSDFLREAVTEKMVREGIIEAEAFDDEDCPETANE